MLNAVNVNLNVNVVTSICHSVQPQTLLIPDTVPHSFPWAWLLKITSFSGRGSKSSDSLLFLYELQVRAHLHFCACQCANVSMCAKGQGYRQQTEIYGGGGGVCFTAAGRMERCGRVVMLYVMKENVST